MKQSDSQQGSLHAVIIVVLFVALMATLGIVFYQNFIVKKVDDTPKHALQQTTRNPTDKTVRVAFNSETYALDYPNSWNAVTAPQDSSTNGISTTFIDAGKAVRVTFSMSEVPGGDMTCSADATQKVTAYTVTSNVNKNLTGQPLALVEAIYDYKSGGYQYNIGLSEDGGATHAAVGDPFCVIAGTFFASEAQYSNDNKLVRPTITAKIDFPKLPAFDKDAASKDMDTLKNLMTTSDYKAAVKILESARKE